MSTFTTKQVLIFLGCCAASLSPVLNASDEELSFEELVIARPSHLPVSERLIEQTENALVLNNSQKEGPENLDPLSQKKSEYRNLYLEAQFDEVIHGIAALDKRLLEQPETCTDTLIYEALADLKMLEAMSRFKKDSNDSQIEANLYQVLAYDPDFTPDPSWHSPSIISRLMKLEETAAETSVTIHINTIPESHMIYLNGQKLGPAQHTQVLNRPGLYRFEARSGDTCRAELIKHEITSLDNERHLTLSVPAFSEAEQLKLRRQFDYRQDREEFQELFPAIDRPVEITLIANDSKGEQYYLMAHISADSYSFVTRLEVPPHPTLEQLAEALAMGRAKIQAGDVKRDDMLESLFWGRHLPRDSEHISGSGASKGWIITGVIVGVAAATAAGIYFTRKPNDATTIIFDGTNLGAQ